VLIVVLFPHGLVGVGQSIWNKVRSKVRRT